MWGDFKVGLISCRVPSYSRVTNYRRKCRFYRTSTYTICPANRANLEIAGFRLAKRTGPPTVHSNAMTEGNCEFSAENFTSPPRKITALFARSRTVEQVHFAGDSPVSRRVCSRTGNRIDTRRPQRRRRWRRWYRYWSAVRERTHTYMRAYIREHLLLLSPRSSASWPAGTRERYGSLRAFGKIKDHALWRKQSPAFIRITG